MKVVFAIVMAMMLSQAFALDDPTRPPGYPLATATGKKVTGPVWHVSSIRIAPNSRTAIINGRTVTRGSRVNGATVIDIEPTKVRLKKAGKQFTVRLFTHGVKKTTRLPIK